MNREPKYDLRDWSADWEKMGNPAKLRRGIPVYYVMQFALMRTSRRLYQEHQPFSRAILRDVLLQEELPKAVSPPVSPARCACRGGRADALAGRTAGGLTARTGIWQDTQTFPSANPSTPAQQTKPGQARSPFVPQEPAARRCETAGRCLRDGLLKSRPSGRLRKSQPSSREKRPDVVGGTPR